MKAIVLGATSGIGKSIAQNLKGTCKKVISLGSKDINTSSLKSVKNFCKKYYGPDILVLNTGGPPDLNFKTINNEIWIENFNKLFLSFSNIIKDIGIKKNGYVFYTIKRGDTLYKIAKKFNATSIDEIRKTNKINNDRGLMPGDVLKIEKNS